MVIKYLGRDCELSTTGIDADSRAIVPWDVVRAVLDQIDLAFRAHGARVWSGDLCRRNRYFGSSSSVDCLRQWISNGQCYYSDMGHVEVCTAPTARAKHFASQCISTLLAVESARRLAESKAGGNVQYALSATNADASDPAISWGTHLNVSVNNRLWEDLCLHHSRPATLGFVASAIAAAIPFFGAGYLLPVKNGSTIYSLSGRAHHMTRLKTLSTTDAWRRGLLNTRREPHGTDQDRLHLIGFDFSIISAALLGVFIQCVLIAAEAGYCGLNVYDPLQALRSWSWGLDMASGRMTGRAAMADGRQLTLAVYVREVTAMIQNMCQRGLISDEGAPEAAELLPIIIELTHHVEAGSVNRSAKHLDWAAKLMCLLSGNHAWGSAAARLADHDFANTDPDRGMLWRLWDEGLVDPLVSIDDARACLTEGPTETRAWARGQIIRKFSENIRSVNWDHVELYRRPDSWQHRLRIDMPHVDSLKRQRFGPIIDHAQNVAQLGDLLEQNTLGNVVQASTDVGRAHHLAVPVDDLEV